MATEIHTVLLPYLFKADLLAHGIDHILELGGEF